MRRAARRDANHADIREALRKAGYLVLDLGSVGKGCPDILVAGHGRMVLMEIKDPSQPPSKRTLTPDEAEFHMRWGRHAVVVETLEDAIAAMRCVTTPG